MQIQIIIIIITIITLSMIVWFIFRPLRNTIINHESALANSITQLEQEGEYKSMFLANMSHELRTPLNGILGVTAIMKSKQVDEELQQFIDIVDTSGNTLLGTIDNILDLTKLEMQQIELEQRPFNPEHLVNSVYQTFRYYPNPNPVNLKQDTESLPAWLVGDEQKIMQIVNNLMSNAIKFTLEGEIRLATKYANETLTVTVSDTGIGVAEDKLALIFEPFKQADSSTKREFGGTGLGLAISKQMALTMDGDLTATSTVNKGTSFTLTLPLKITDELPIAEPIKQQAPIEELSVSGNILIAEDNMINYQVLAKMLEKMDLQYQHAIDGVQSVELVQLHKFDLILMDYHMPNMNGIDAIKAINALDIATPPIVMLTADITDATKKEAHAVGVVDFLEKPINIKKLQSVITHCLTNIP